MCTSPVLVRLNSLGVNEDSVSYRRKYRLGLPTNHRVKVVKKGVNSANLPHDVYVAAIERKIEERKQSLANLPFTTEQQEIDLKRCLIDYNWVKEQSSDAIKLFLYRPMLLNVKGHATPCMLVPCGHCEECINKRSSELRFKVMHDVTATPSCDAYMLTLTYDNVHLPTDTDVSQVGDGSTDGLAHCDTGFLCRQDITNYLKRLRQILHRWYHIDNVKFFYCGEYGKKTCRPHYHVLVWFPLNSAALFGYEYKGKFTGKQSIFSALVRMNNGKVPRLSESFRSISFECWGNCKRQAFVCERCRSLTASSNYITKYLGKSLTYKHQGLPPELADLFAPHAVPMFVRASCRLAENWAQLVYNCPVAVDGFVEQQVHDKNGHTFTYKQAIPRSVRNYIDELRKENDCEDVSQLRRNALQDLKIQEIILSEFWRKSPYCEQHIPLDLVLRDPVFMTEYAAWSKRHKMQNSRRNVYEKYLITDVNDTTNNL